MPNHIAHKSDKRGAVSHLLSITSVTVSHVCAVLNMTQRPTTLPRTEIRWPGHLAVIDSWYCFPPSPPRPLPPPPIPPAIIPKIVSRAQLLTAEPQADDTARGVGISGRQPLDVLIMTHGHPLGFTQNVDALQQ